MKKATGAAIIAVLCITNIYVSASMQIKRTSGLNKENGFVCSKIWKQQTSSLLGLNYINNIDYFAAKQIKTAAINKEETRTYWTIPLGDYQVSLQDLTAGESLKLVFGRDNMQQVVCVYDKTEYMSPESITAVPFEQLLGHNGIYISMKPNKWSCYTDYYGIEDGELVFLADSWGYKRDDYIIDIDGDGDRELICNVTFLGDGAACTRVYDYNSAQILVGWGDMLLDVEYDNWGTNSTWSEYLPEKNVIRISYSKIEGGIGEKEYPLDLDKLEMEPYQKP